MTAFKQFGQPIEGTVPNGAMIWDGSGWTNQLIGLSNLGTDVTGIPPDNAFKRRAGTIAETYSRSGATFATGNAITSGQPYFVSIVLRTGQVIGHISFWSGNTAADTPTHQWFTLCDKSMVQLLTTADDLTTAWGTNAEKKLAVAQIASGADSSYTVPSDDIYYLGIVVTANATPTFLGNNGNSTLNNQSPNIAGNSSSTGLTTPPAFPHTYGAMGGLGREAYAEVS